MRHSLLNGFAFFALNLFARVADTFAFVRLRRIVAADIGGDLANELAVDPLDLDLRVLRDRDLDPGRDGEDDRVREPEGEVQGATLDIGFETDALDFQVFAEAIRNAGDHVVDQRAGKAMQRTDLPALIGALHDKVASFHACFDGTGQLPVQLAFWAFRQHSAFGRNGQLDLRRN